MCDPYCNRNVVRGLAIGYGQEAMHAEEELGAAVVISYNGNVREKVRMGLVWTTNYRYLSLGGGCCRLIR